MTCPKCNTQNQEGSKFCQSCGSSLQSTWKQLRSVLVFLFAIAGVVVAIGFFLTIFLYVRMLNEQKQTQQLGNIIKNEIVQNQPSGASIPAGYKQYTAKAYAIFYPDSWLKTTKINSGDLEEPTAIFRDLNAPQEVSLTINVFAIPAGKDVDLEEALKAGLSSTETLHPNSQTADYLYILEKFVPSNETGKYDSIFQTMFSSFHAQP